ncbi:tRNA (adenosine(37)-N6)-dimethylallyltransferase MiaA [Streptococcus gallolyticus]|nr:tRNA (adenosine(37)-N6)-dimethylallyltransferase MiaA [Streptococcus gallolyticus]MBY5041173.1 tRNA (adenosine(37)-N6)-dimethylallyltransferase MiaA [Streptococcus gallolyticus]
MKTKIIVVLGPTAVGKTVLGIELARKYNGEIISGDSQQVYRKLDIGTAKASPEEQAAAVHHLLDVREVTQSYSAFDFVQEASDLIADIASRGKLPIIVGGTGLYLQSLLEGYHLGGDIDQEAVLDYRSELESLSDETLFQMAELENLVIPQLNRRRAIRGLELKKFGKDLENQEPSYEALLVSLSDDRQLLYNRINERVDKMMDMGLLDEAKWLYETYPNCQAAMGIGYKELFPYFSGQQSLEEALEKLKQNTRRFAKRQLTWFRNRMKVDFYQVSEAGSQGRILADVERFLHD